MIERIKAASVEVMTAEQSNRVERIKSYHSRFMLAFGDQMTYAFLCGIELNSAKAELPHGQFTVWRKAHLPELSNGSVHRYMLFADALQAIFPTRGKFQSQPLLIGSGGLDEQEREQVLLAVHEIADGRTITQLYRDLGVIRQPKAPKHTPSTKSAKQTALDDKVFAEESARGLVNRMQAMINDPVALTRIPLDLLDELDQVTIDFRKLVGQMRKSRKD